MRHSRHAEAKKHGRRARDKSKPSSDVAAAPALSGDLAAVKNAIDLARKAKTDEATAVQKTIGDPAGQKLVEWFILRHPDADARFARFAAFIADNPSWPGMALMRRRAEARLWQERSDAATVRGFTGDQPTSTKGRLALARTLLAEGNRDGAVRWVREAWRSDEFSERLESEAYETFRDLLTREGIIRRGWTSASAPRIFGRHAVLRKRLGSNELSIVKACVSAMGNESKALDRLDGVDIGSVRDDLGYTLCRIHALMRRDQLEDAARLTLAAAPQAPWRCRTPTKMVAQAADAGSRKLLDLGKFETAYEVVRDAALPAGEYYRADFCS